MFSNFTYRDHSIGRIFSHLIVKNPDEYVSSSYHMPPVEYISHPYTDIVWNVTRGMVSEHVDHMIEAGNISGALTSLGGTPTDNIIDVICKDFTQKIQIAEFKINVYQESPRKLKKWVDKKNKYTEQLQQIQSRLQTQLNQAECPICLQAIQNPTLLSCCHHVFCGECILKCIQTSNKCPLCREYTHQHKIIHTTLTSTQSPPPSKQQIIKKIIQPDRKVIIFSSHMESFHIIKQTLQSHSYIEMIGNHANREHNLNRYKHGKTNILLLHSIQNGAGLHIPETTDIILYHSMPPDIRKQLIGRALRIGRTAPLRIHEFTMN